ncbi:carbohydrate ABC transporter permease [Globicatella sanguinis]|uniref:carbohydrate ABC transporter permease n=1 Tax=Globicatella sanguinis TaxID=13076 RepID=UPI002543E0DD|nr:sugar ABC transporter permease [Globicatella sanguinis]MDK7631239.1 sugar ABC transporter permease [Globicatella sanguinis]WIK67143.1 sugar ABC transporter permease [Globicatella sanguinis]WKT56548.1 sugar ABC transporter permease [Globicatella sanguinis]
MLNRLKRKYDISGYLFIAPAMIFFLTYVLYPMIKGIHMSLFKFRGRRQIFVGIDNYTKLLSDNVFLRSMGNTMFIVAIAVPIVVVLSLFIAINIYNKSAAVRSFFRGVFYLPAVSSVVSITVVWLWIYNPDFGILNYVLKSMNIIDGNIQWLGNSQTAIYAIIVVLITTSIGQPIILYIAALGNVPVELLESAKIDGASNWVMFKNIIWPLIIPTTLYIVVTTTINSFQIFALIQLMTAGGPNYSTSTVMYLVYEAGIKIQDYGRASAMGVVLAAIIAIISTLQFKYLNKDIE